MKPYVPEMLPLKSLKWDSFMHLVGKANFQLARYAGILQGIVNPQIFLSPLTTNEAVLSSQIEGSQATLAEVLNYDALPKPDIEKHEDIVEVVNYRNALLYAARYLKKKPVNLNLIKEVHGILLQNARGKDKARGEFRRVQNWIGRPGTPMEEASYVPPPPEKVMELLDNLEKYFHTDDKDHLVQLALIHGQFELIHPFVDGNGRVGRMLIPLFLLQKRLLNGPNFYISAYFESHRETYYDRLRNISNKAGWDSWITFFLEAVIAQSQDNSDKACKVMGLYEELKPKMVDITKSKFAMQALDALFEQPIFSTTGFISRSKIPKLSALRILKGLEDHKLIRTVSEGRGSQPAMMKFYRLFNIVK
jgi:Fic family protein